MSKNNRYKLKQMFSQLSKEDHSLAIKVCYKELEISERTFFRDLNGTGEDIPHFRLLQYCKFLGVEDKALEDFDRHEINVRPLQALKTEENKEVLRTMLNLEK